MTDIPASPASHLRNVMTDEDFDRARDRFDETYGKDARQAGVRREQALATLYYNSGWTQERIAEKEKARGNKGASRRYISYKLIFGRFLNFGTMVPKVENLTERRFRDHYDLTDKSQPEPARFREAARRLEEDDERRTSSHTNPVGKAIRARFMDDGKWHTAAAIAKAIDQPEAEVTKTLDHAVGRKGANATYQVEKQRRPRGVFEYRILSKEKAISTIVLIEKLTPIVEFLREQGKTHVATLVMSACRSTASQLENLLKEWTE